MNFLENLKDQIEDPRLGNGRHKSKVLVSQHDLRELIHYFELLDSTARLENREPKPAYHHLHEAISQVFIANHNQGDITLLAIMETLAPLIEDNQKEKAIGRKR
jgi:hypothetical protein